MAGIVISYRRGDTQAMTGRLFDRLTERFGYDAVFMDIDKIPVGADFREYIRKTIADCNLMLVVIGDRWVGTGPQEQTHLLEPSDPVRIEIEAAIEKKIPIVPVLVDGIDMPGETSLPESIRSIVYRNAAVVSSGRDFHRHADDLIESIEGLLPAGALESQAPKNRKSWDFLPLRSLLAFVTPLLIAIGVYLAYEFSPLHATRNAKTVADWGSRELAVLASLFTYYLLLVPAYTVARRKRLDRRALAVYWAGALIPLAAGVAWGDQMLAGLSLTAETGFPPLLTSSSLLVAGMAVAIAVGLVLALRAVRTITPGEVVTYWAGITGSAMIITSQIPSLVGLSPDNRLAALALALLSALVMIVVRRSSMEVIERQTYRTTAWVTGSWVVLAFLIQVLPWWGWVLVAFIIAGIGKEFLEYINSRPIVVQVASNEKTHADDGDGSRSKRDDKFQRRRTK